MKHLNLKLLLVVLTGYCLNISAQVTVYIKDKHLKTPIAKATIVFDNNINESDNSGKVILNISRGKQYIEVYHGGYFTFKGYLSPQTKQTIFLKGKREVLNETVIHGKRHRTEQTEIVSRLSATNIHQNTSTSIGEILSKIEGVTSIKTGATIVKPVLHGMYGNRIVILNNGVVQQGQSWSTEHAPEIDPYMAKSISVVKGADGVKYGSGAIGGVVLINPKKLPYTNNEITGALTSVLSSNGNASTFSAVIGSSFAKNKMAWQVQGTRHISADIKTADYFLNNTGTNSYSYSGNLGYTSDKFGIEGYYSFYKNTYGIAFISEVGNQDDFDIRFTNGQPLQFFPASYTIDSPKQVVSHHLGKANGYWKPNSNSIIKLQYDFQNNNRAEYFVRRGGLSDIPAFHTKLKTHRFNATYNHKFNKYWKSETGVSYQHQSNKNVSGTKIDPIIPNYTNIELGGFAIGKYSKNNIKLSAGIRYDIKKEQASGIKNHLRYNNSRNFKNWVGSLSGTYFLNNLSFTSNLAMAWRSPHVNELYSNGLKHGALFYAIGDQNLSPENGLKWTGAVTYQNENLHINLSGFLQKLNNYIYDQPTKEVIALWGGNYFTSYYLQADAFFRGIDINANYQINPNWSYTTKGSLVHATNLENDGFFPFIPSERLYQEIRFSSSLPKSSFDELYTSFGHQFVAKQTRIDQNSDIKPSPDSYHLINISGGFNTKISNNKKLSFHISISNVFNKSYKEYTNRFRYFNHDMGRNIQLKTTINF